MPQVLQWTRAGRRFNFVCFSTAPPDLVCVVETTGRLTTDFVVIGVDLMLIVDAINVDCLLPVAVVVVVDAVLVRARVGVAGTSRCDLSRLLERVDEGEELAESGRRILMKLSL